MSKKVEDASGSGQGYLYQFLLGLNLALQKSRTSENFEISIENFDDIAFVDDKSLPLELIQSKHRSTPKNISNGSRDLWKTIAIWIERDKEYNIEGSDLFYYLVTNASCSPKSAAEYLRSQPENRNVDLALSVLIETAKAAEDASTLEYRNLFLGTSNLIRKDLLNRIFVIDNTPGIQELSNNLKNEFLTPVMDKHKPLIVERLTGWWISVVIKLLSDTKQTIPISVIKKKLQSICYEYHNENLPIEFLLAEPGPTSSWDKRTFVQQLYFITNRSPRIKDAIRDYYRACEQRLKWAREDLLLGDEMDKYEIKLIEEWERFRNAILDEMPQETDEDKVKCGLRIYRWMETQAQIPIRKHVEEAYVMRGSFHMLADDSKVGWHPEFIEKLKIIFGV